MFGKSTLFKILKKWDINYELVAICLSVFLMLIPMVVFLFAGFAFMASRWQFLKELSQIGFVTVFVGGFSFMLIASFCDVDDVLRKAHLNKFRTLKGGLK